MARMFAVTFSNVAVAAGHDLFEIQPADDKPVLIHGVYLSQNTELGDAAEEQLRIHILRGYTTPGLSGTSYTPVPMNPNSSAAGFTAKINNWTVAQSGTASVLHAENFNLRSGWVFMPTPEARPIANQANTTLVVRLMDNPTDSVTMAGTLIIEEI